MSVRIEVADVNEYVYSNANLRQAIGLSDGARFELRPLGMGEHNLNYLLDVGPDRRFVVRVNVAKQPFHDDQVGYEFAALEALAPSGRAPAPVYLDNEDAALSEGVLVETFCEGEMLDFDNVRDGDLRCAAQIMADVHAVPVERGYKLYRPTDPLKDLFDECLQRFETYRMSAFEDARITAWARRFMVAAERAMRDAPPADGSLHIVNTETLPSHFLIPADSAAQAARNTKLQGRFCDNPGYFVDWERPILGEVAQDVAYFVSPTTTYWDSEFLFPDSAVETFVDDYWRAVDGRFERGSFDARFGAWRAMTALRSVTWCCRALINYSGDADSHTTDKTARKLPVYLSGEFMEMVAASCFGL